jgi:hypothetical protein
MTNNKRNFIVKSKIYSVTLIGDEEEEVYEMMYESPCSLWFGEGTQIDQYTRILNEGHMLIGIHDKK